MSKPQRGALVEYAYKGSIPYPVNVVFFQFNPDKLTRVLKIPPRAVGKNEDNKEASQAGDTPIETISLVAQLSAADELAVNNPLARAYGVGARLAALEKLVTPVDQSVLGSIVGKDAAAGLNTLASAAGIASSQPVPRLQYPRILFIWGSSRVLPVIVDSMSIAEQQFDSSLNPVEAEVTLSLSVVVSSDDLMGVGAFTWSSLQKQAQATAYLATTLASAAEIIPF